MLSQSRLCSSAGLDGDGEDPPLRVAQVVRGHVPPASSRPHRRRWFVSSTFYRADKLSMHRYNWIHCSLHKDWPLEESGFRKLSDRDHFHSSLRQLLSKALLAYLSLQILFSGRVLVSGEYARKYCTLSIHVAVDAVSEAEACRQLRISPELTVVNLYCGEVSGTSVLQAQRMADRLMEKPDWLFEVFGL